MAQPDVFQWIAASGPFADYADKLMLFGQFVGSWEIDSIWYEPDGNRRSGKGEWHFRWILGGRGIQDVLFPSGAASHQVGTTLRCYDVALGAWHASWMQPSSGEFAHLLGRKVGDGIVQELLGLDPPRRERWSFTAITSESFVWLDEVSLNDGVTWSLQQEMRARRQKA
jgi:hypothetical protein